MEYECSPVSWEFSYQEEGLLLEELRHSLLYTTLELEATIASAKEEISKRECELSHVNCLLSKVIKERDEAQAKCQKLMLEKLELQQKQLVLQALQQQQMETIITSHDEEDEPQGGGGGSLSEKEQSSPADTAADSPECEENSSSIIQEKIVISASANSTDVSVEFAINELAEKKPLPEKGKLLKAVVEAGPLLQTILLAGPLPQWQHPPPQINSIEIPPLPIHSSPSPTQTPNPSPSFSFSKKRGFVPSSDDGVHEFPLSNSKCRKVVHQLPTTPTTTHSLPLPSFS